MFFPEAGLDRVHLDFEPSAYQYLFETFSSAYGAPDKVVEEAVQTAMGAKFLNHKPTWARQIATMELRQYGGKISRGDGTILTNARHRELSEAAKEGKKTAVEDVR
jgi:hypothetical protein